MDWRNLVGARIAAYQIDTVLDRGAYAIIYLGHDVSAIQTPIVLKVLPRDVRDEQVVARFRREVELVQALRHPHIMPVFATGEDDQMLWMAMPLAVGGTVRQRIDREGRFVPRRAAAHAYQILAALAALHAMGYVHRDIKPANLLYLEADSDHVVVGDFGIAYTSALSHLTRTGTTIGTPEYMSPEQLRGEPLTGQSDLYAVGIVLYELLIGHPPFQGNTPVATGKLHLGRAVPWPLLLPPGLNDALRLILLRALAKQPSERFPDAEAMQRALAPWCRGLLDGRGNLNPAALYLTAAREVGR